MAEVLRPIVPSNSPLSVGQSAQSPPPEKHTRNSPSPHNHNTSRVVQMPRNNNHHHHPHHVNGGPTYRGASASPTYAFKSTPTLQSQPKSGVQASQQQSTVSSAQPLSNDNSAANRGRYPSPPSVSTSSSSNTSSNPSSTPSAAPPTLSTWSSLFAKNDSSFSSNFQVAPFTTEKTNKDALAAEAVPEATSDAFPPLNQAQGLNDPSSKTTPNRYRRAQKRVDTPTSAQDSPPHSGPTPMGQFSHSTQSNGVTPKLTTEIPSAELGSPDANKNAEFDRTDVAEPQASPGVEQGGSKPGLASLNRYRRRSSVNTLDGSAKVADSTTEKSVAPSSPSAERPSSPLKPMSSSKQNQRTASPTRGLPLRTDGSSGPAKTFAEVARRTNTPSPLSRPVTPDHASRTITPSSPPVGAAPAQNSAFQNSPAVAAMAALSEKDNQKGVKSRLRRAFSFGSSAELNRATQEAEEARDRAQARREKFSTELDEEQASIARQQEAAGLGESIYSGQAGFAGSTDNLSISSTASSASMMLRKMGKGVKKGGRSIKGLFRPKSAIGVPPPDGPLGAGVGEISRVTVEAEREKVNINADPRDQSGGGTGFPKLERNSFDAVRASLGDDKSRPHHADVGHDNRKSIVGGDSDRAEVLASVKRSILKRSNTGSPTASPTLRPADSAFTQHDNPSLERHISPVPSNNSTSEIQRNGHLREMSGGANNDYFGKLNKIGNQSSRSLPGTPRSTNSRNISFSPRIVFHDVWSSAEYDRRGDIATCNRLTPMLAQQIKEELNTFKMEMEVHEMSKPHTHFF
ncbi:MAG: hypothetical protein Q9162_005328 [Coniocarpon cinnabarinum]